MLSATVIRKLPTTRPRNGDDRKSFKKADNAGSSGLEGEELANFVVMEQKGIGRFIFLCVLVFLNKKRRWKKNVWPARL